MKTFVERCSNPIIEYLLTHYIVDKKYSKSRFAAQLPVHGEVEDAISGAEYGNGDKKHDLKFKWRTGEIQREDVYDTIRNDNSDSMSVYYCGEIAKDILEESAVNKNYKMILSGSEFDIFAK